MARKKKEVVEEGKKQVASAGEGIAGDRQEGKPFMNPPVEPVVYKPKLTDEDCREAEFRCKRYHEKMQPLENRLIENETYYRQQYSDYKDTDDRKSLPEKGSGYLINAIINKVADMMDNYPQPTILPREESDEETASILSKVIPAILERNNYTKVYYGCAMEKVKNGVSVAGVFWNPTKDNIGDVEIKRIDIINMRWEPNIEDIQDSKEVFILTESDVETMKVLYPQILGNLTGEFGTDLSSYSDSEVARAEDKVIVYDWYYKKTVSVEIGGQVFPKTVLHYAKFCNGKLLYASENDPAKESGWYEDGQYPFIFDVMYPIKNTPVGFGMIDIIREPQEFIDKMNKALIQNVLANARPRRFAKDSTGINEEEFNDYNNLIVHYEGDPNGIVPIDVNPLPPIYAQILENVKEELKENSGNRDFSQGATSGGVTAASAIAALQEASSKTSRTMNLVSYDAFKSLITMVISRMQQFYSVPRTYRIIMNNENYYAMVGISKDSPMASDSMAELLPDSVFDQSIGKYMGGHKPIYDISVGAEKASPYSRVAQNEFAKELFQLGVFNPQLADQTLGMLKMMDFDQKEEIIQMVSQNQTLLQENAQMKQLLQGLGGIVAETTGDTRIMQMFGMPEEAQAMPGKASGQSIAVNQLGEARKENTTSQAEKARIEARERAGV